MSNNGVKETHGSDYATDYFPDIIANRSLAFMSKQAAARRRAKAAAAAGLRAPSGDDAAPFFAMVAFPTCHQPAAPAPQFKDKCVRSHRRIMIFIDGATGTTGTRCVSREWRGCGWRW